MAIIGILGKKQSGKNTVASIIQYLTRDNMFKELTIEDYLIEGNSISTWQQKSFAGKLKEIVCILTGCTMEQLEDEEFKNNPLGEEWIRYGYADGFIKKYIGNGEIGQPIMNNVQCDKERYELELKTNWQTAYKYEHTYRSLLQYLGTEVARQITQNIWINALMKDYTPKICSGTTHCALAGKPDISCNLCPEYPNWIITDVRFPNELQAVKNKQGFTIRVNRLIGKRVYIISNEQPFENWYGTVKSYNGNNTYNIINNVDDVILVHKNQITFIDEHPSETSLDNATFDYVIENDGTVEELIEKVKQILIKEHII